MKKKINDLIEKSISGEWGEDPKDGSGIKVIRTANFTNDGVLNLENIVLREIEAEKIESKKLLKGDIIIEKSGGSPTQPVGRVVFFNEDDIFLTNNFTNILRPNTQIVYPKFLFYVLFNFHKNGRTLKYQNKTTGIINLKLANYLNEEVSLPSYGDQIRISRLLEKIEDLIKERKNLIELLKELVTTVFYQLFGNPVNNEKGWELDKLESLGVLDRGVSKHRPRNAPALLGGEYPLIQTGDVSNAGLWLNRYTQTYSDLGLKQSKLWPAGTLVITIAANIAKTSILTFQSCFPDSIVGFIANEKKTDTIFVHYLFSFFQKLLEKNAPQSAQKNINLAILRDLVVPVPPLELQNQFATVAQKIESLKTEQEAQVKVMEELYASISQKVFAGRVDLSKIHVDEALIPKETPFTHQAEVEERDEHDYDAHLNIEKEKATPTNNPKEAAKPIVESEPKRTSALSWDTVSFKEVATYISQHFGAHYFNAEMLLCYLEEELGMYVHYFSSEEQRKNPQYEQADDFLSFVSGALTGQNTYLQLEQAFYNAETENIHGISFTKTDLENLATKTKRERSGIYFRIKNETTPG